MCGEHESALSSCGELMGSSPRVRGTRRLHRLLRGRPGIIPACAGNTDGSGLHAQFDGDHPRVCGEHLLVSVLVLVVSGSSPRVRGTRIRRSRCSLTPGIIPACAGNTTAASRTPWPNWDHPRVCGEHLREDALSLSLVGSSPRVRGTHDIRSKVHHNIGIIPACAGNTPSR